MAGCYGNHPFDRHFERLLDEYLDQWDDPIYELYCLSCGYETTSEEIEPDSSTGVFICPKCEDTK